MTEQITNLLKDIAGSLHQISLTARMIRTKMEDMDKEASEDHKAKKELTIALLHSLKQMSDKNEEGKCCRS